MSVVVRRKFFIAILIAAMVVAVAAWLGLQSDTVSAEKSSSITLIQTLSPARISLSKCLENAQKATSCIVAAAELLPHPDASKQYLLTQQGEFIGVDYSDRVIVILTPLTSTGEVRWQCAVTPKHSSKQCNDGLLGALP